METNMECIERNYNILERRMVEQTDTSLNYGRSLIDSELDSGLLFIMKPIIKSFYKYWSDKDARVGTLEQIKLTLNSAKELIVNGEISKEQFDEIVDRDFSTYLKNDQTDRQCKKDHRNYNSLKEVTKKCFITQLEESVLFLKVKEEINDYAGLSRAAFKTKERAHQALMRQLDYNEEGLAIVESDQSILKVPVAKNVIITILRKGFELTKKQLIEELDEIFN